MDIGRELANIIHYGIRTLQIAIFKTDTSRLQTELVEGQLCSIYHDLSYGMPT